MTLGGPWGDIEDRPGVTLRRAPGDTGEGLGVTLGTDLG